MGAVRRLALTGRAPELAPWLAPETGARPAPGDPWPALRSYLARHADEVRELVARGVQTNEIGRCAALLGGFHAVARATGLPLRVLEVGASAGLNLRWDAFRYEGSGMGWGDPASPVRVPCDFAEGAPPLVERVAVAERRGCDPRPLDPTSEDGRLTLLSFVWADQHDRVARLEAAIEVARGIPARVDERGAADWLAERLSRPAPGRATVVVHTIVVQYLDPGERARMEAVLTEAAAAASAEAPLARLSLEPAGEWAEVRLARHPPGSDERIALSGYHGRPVRWLGAG
jgi:hypothetical protein